MKKHFVLLFFLFTCVLIDKSESATSLSNQNLSDSFGQSEIAKQAQFIRGSTSGIDPLIVIVLMVKNEASVIRETLQPFIDEGLDAFLILDTGSTDDTIPNAKTFFEKNHVNRAVIKQEPFVNFSVSRNRALGLAEESFPNACFMLMLDAEWYTKNVKDLVRFCDSHKEDTSPVYLMRIIGKNVDYYVPRLIRCHYNARFVGSVHEVINKITQEKVSPETFFDWQPSSFGLEKSKTRWSRDLDLLLQEFKSNPHDPRTIFYIAQTYDCLDDWKNASLWYELRSNISGWDEENFMATYRLAQVYEKLDQWEKAEHQYLLAFSMRPSRAEPLIQLADHYINVNDFDLCFLFAKRASEIPYPKDDVLFIEKNLYDYERYNLLGISSWYVGDYKLGMESVLKALQIEPNAPHLHNNLALYESRLAN